MRLLQIMGLSMFLLASPNLGIGGEQADPAHDAMALFESHPGKVLGLGVCLGMAVAGPAAIGCAAALGGGLVIDDHIPLLHHAGHSH